MSRSRKWEGEATSKVHRHEGTYVLYPPNTEHGMWFRKEMKGFWI